MSMKTTDRFDEAAAAHAKVQGAIAALRNEHDTVIHEIDATAAELARQQNLHLPVADLRAAIGEMLMASAVRFEKNMRGTIASFAMHNFGNPAEIPPAVRVSRKPMTFAHVESTIAGEIESYSHINLFQAGVSRAFDAPLLLLFGELVLKRLAEILDGISPEEFGYENVSASEIGCGLKERRALVMALRTQLADLEARREDIARKLMALGYSIHNQNSKW